MDLSKAFDCIKHDLLIANLDAYGFSHEALCLGNSYLENRHQRVKINGSFGTYKQLFLGVPQGSALGPLFFNIYINDLLLSLMDTDICNNADETTLYACDKNLNNVIARLENDSSITIQWFADNFMKLNTNKCHLLILGKSSYQQVKYNVGDSIIENSEEDRLLGVVIDKKLSFETHISKLFKKACSKLTTLARISGYMNANKLKILMRAFVISQFEYCPLVWMFHSRHLNSKINRIHERALRIAYKDYDSGFNTLLENDGSVNIHVKHLRNLLMEMFKTKGNINPPFMREIFCEHHAVYNLRNNNEFMVERVRTTIYGTETIKYRGQRLWLSLPQHIRNAQSINEFNKEMKSWNGTDCTCKLCRTLVPQLGFL